MDRFLPLNRVMQTSRLLICPGLLLLACAGFLSACTGAMQVPDEDVGSVGEDAATGTDAVTPEDARTGDAGSDVEPDVSQPDAIVADVPSGAPPTALEGFGTETSGGAGGDVCTVTNLNDDGEGSLRDCVTSREGTGDSIMPRVVEFEVGGTITLETDLYLREPFLTVDGSTAPAPGITIEKRDLENGEFIIAGTRRGHVPHDIIIRYLRFDGGWGGGELHSNNSSTITIDGENNDEGVYRVVFDHIACVRGSDGSPDLWGTIRDVTISWSLFHHNLHPTTISHTDPTIPRERISLHHNVYAYNHERNPQVRGAVRQLDVVNQVVFEWKLFGGGYGIRLRELGGVVPTDVRIAGGFFWSRQEPDSGLLLAPTDYSGRVFLTGNIGIDESMRTVDEAFDLPPEGRVTIYEAGELDTAMLPHVGLPVRTAEENATFEAIAEAIQTAR